MSGSILLLLAQAGDARFLPSPAARASIAESKGDGPALTARLDALAGGGDTSANELLGEILQKGGFGITRDLAKACDRFARTADTRGDSAQNLAQCLFTGEGRPQDFPAARKWYGRADALGWPAAACALGNMLIAGQGGAPDPAAGLALCRRAAAAGNADAQTDLANYLLAGKIIARDIVAARRWYERAALQRQANAALVLGQIHWNGDGTPVNHGEAARWWRVAHEGGRKDAAGLLAREALSRLIVSTGGRKSIDRQVLPEATEWLRRAAADDPDPARRQEFAKLLAELDVP